MSTSPNRRKTQDPDLAGPLGCAFSRHPHPPLPRGTGRFRIGHRGGFEPAKASTPGLPGVVALTALLGTTWAQTTYSGPPTASGSASGWRHIPGLTQDMLVVLAAGAILLALLLLWARFLRKKPHSRPGSGHRSSPAVVESDDAESDHAGHHRHRRKRRRREHRSRNPTLAETGGLPAARPESHPPRAT